MHRVRLRWRRSTHPGVTGGDNLLTDFDSALYSRQPKVSAWKAQAWIVHTNTRVRFGIWGSCTEYPPLSAAAARAMLRLAFSLVIHSVVSTAEVLNRWDENSHGEHRVRVDCSGRVSRESRVLSLSEHNSRFATTCFSPTNVSVAFAVLYCIVAGDQRNSACENIAAVDTVMNKATVGILRRKRQQRARRDTVTRDVHRQSPSSDSVVRELQEYSLGAPRGQNTHAWPISHLVPIAVIARTSCAPHLDASNGRRG